MTVALCAENRALLIAVPDTPYSAMTLPLEGPSNDVAALRSTLVDQWGFRDDHIRTLDGRESNKAAILDALDRLVDETSAGDHVLVYFSGHGTSFLGGQTGLRRDTGALVPADIKDGTEAEVIDGLIVGSRDLRPRFDRLDHSGAEALVLFDACYSGDSAKSMPRLQARSTELFARRTEVSVADLIGEGSADAPWPYERVIYISASARHEQAWDIGADQARSTHPTIDGLAHGAFTDGLLRGLRGAADRDRDGQIAYSELQEFLTGRVLRHEQTPQLRPLGRPVVERPLFGRSAVPQRPLGPAGSNSLRVPARPTGRRTKRASGGPRGYRGDVRPIRR